MPMKLNLSLFIFCEDIIFHDRKMKNLVQILVASSLTILAWGFFGSSQELYPGGSIFGIRGCAGYMRGFFLGAKYVDMGIFWNLYLWV